MAKIKFSLVTQERTVLSEEVDSLTCPTTEGEIQILPGHVPLIATLKHGELIAKVNGENRPIVVAGGFVEVRPGNEVVILADMAELADEMDLEAVEEAHKLAQELMASAKAKNISAAEYAQAATNLQRSFARIKVARKHAPRTPGHRATLKNQ